MTAPFSQQTVSVKETVAVRKRRRRAPVGGAADDCFTCSKRNVKCDRRRPYCSQCLEIGNECSGYKTQLTWGIGVASRGKLRGLSLPVAKAPPVSRERKKPPPISRGRDNSTAAVVAARWTEEQETGRDHHHHEPIDMPSVVQSAPNSAHGYADAGHDDCFAAPTHRDTPPYVSQQHSCSSISYSSSLLNSPDANSRYSRVPLPLSTDGLSSSVGSDYFSPLGQAYYRDEFPFGSASPIIYDGYLGSQHSPVDHSPSSGPVLDHRHTRGPNSCPDLMYGASEDNFAVDSQFDPTDAYDMSHKLIRERDSLDERHLAPCPAFPF